MLCALFSVSICVLCFLLCAASYDGLMPSLAACHCNTWYVYVMYMHLVNKLSLSLSALKMHFKISVKRPTTHRGCIAADLHGAKLQPRPTCVQLRGADECDVNTEGAMYGRTVDAHEHSIRHTRPRRIHRTTVETLLNTTTVTPSSLQIFWQHNRRRKISSMTDEKDSKHYQHKVSK